MYLYRDQLTREARRECRFCHKLAQGRYWLCGWRPYHVCRRCIGVLMKVGMVKE